jgi:hypothetical protein
MAKSGKSKHLIYNPISWSMWANVLAVWGGFCTLFLHFFKWPPPVQTTRTAPPGQNLAEDDCGAGPPGALGGENGAADFFSLC